MKRIITVFIVSVLLLSLSACAPIPRDKSSYSTGTGTLPAQNEEVATEALTEAAQPASSISPGNYISKGPFKLSFEKASLFDEAGDDDILKQHPDEGKRFLICFFEVENISSEDQYVNPLYFSAYLDDYAINSEYLLYDVNGYSMLSGNLQPGKKTKGLVCFQVGDGWQKLEFTYKDGLYKAETYDFIVTPNDIT